MIGILAGMGPKSTGPFVNQVVSAFQRLTEAKNDIDFPPMLVYALPTPFYVDRPIDHSLMEKTIFEGLQKLQACGVSFIAMPCNTAHLYFSKLQQHLQVPLLNMVTLTLDQLPKTAKKVTILATRPTIDSEVYQQGLKNTDFELIIDPEWQSQVDALILSVKSSTTPQQSQALWKALSNSLSQAQIDTIILACTDLSPIVPAQATDSPFKVVDSSQCLAEAVVRKWEEEKGRGGNGSKVKTVKK